MTLKMHAATHEMWVPPIEIDRVVQAALSEDLPWGDLTTESLVPVGLAGVAVVEARERGVLAGLGVARRVFLCIDPDVQFQPLAADGARMEAGEVIARVHGPFASLLKAERVALNFLQRLSGIATATSRYVEAVAGLPVRILDTRKTTPGLRLLEKYAVRVGGGHNHRYCLSDGVLVKDNHLAALRRAGISLRDAVTEARGLIPHTIKVEIEAESLAEVDEALAAGADAILLDNMTPAQLAEAVGRIGGRAITEASGNINLHNVRAVAETGVDSVSVGSLTHSVKALDLAMEIEVD